MSENKRQFNKDVYFDLGTSSSILFILHGWGQNKESWFEVAQKLSKQYRVICFDLFELEASTIEGYADLFYQFLRERKITNINILAHSFGGRIAIQLAAKYTIVDKLILFSSAGIITKPTLLSRISKLFPKSKLKEKFANKFRSRDYKNAGELKNTFLNSINFNVLPLLPLIHIPTLILWGDKDNELPVMQTEIFHKNIQGSEVKIMKGYGHFAHLQNPILFSSIISNFLHENH